MMTKPTKFTVCICITLTFILKSIGVMAQSIEYKDLLNLQKCDFGKAKGFFEYKSFTWHSSEKNVYAFQKNGYQITADRIKWRKNSEEVQFIPLAINQNIIIYYLDGNGFAKLENETKKYALKSTPEVQENKLTSIYTLPQSIYIVFNTLKTSNYGSYKTSYEVLVYNTEQVDQRILSLCDNCLGSGQIAEFQSCYYCQGHGKQKCNKCSGKGKLYCHSCKDGYNQCNSCWGKGTNSCNACWGSGTKQCGSCYGQGTKSCKNCWGSGTVTNTTFGVTYTAKCSNCAGTGSYTCEQCKGNKNFTCTTCSGQGTTKCNRCSGSGKKLCEYCKGSFSQNCGGCQGTGHTDIICTSCNGKGVTGQSIKKVCPACNGNKTK